MREILFRGKTKVAGEWIAGSLVLYPEDYEIGTIIVFENRDEGGFIFGNNIEVNLNTVGQYTGLTDKNGKKIFEGDIVKTKTGRACIVVWFSSQVHCGWDLESIRTAQNCTHTQPPPSIDLYKSDNLEIVGNIHDNPELLEE